MAIHDLPSRQPQMVAVMSRVTVPTEFLAGEELRACRAAQSGVQTSMLEARDA